MKTIIKTTIKGNENLTAKQLYNICLKNKYIIVRYVNGQITAINCKVVTLKIFDNIKNKNHHTRFISYKPCSFMDYISNKTPFMS